MSIEQRKGNLLQMHDINVILHVCNLYSGKMGAGIAKQIAEMYPAVLNADKRTSSGDVSKLGTYSWAKVEGLYGKKTIFNIYAMKGIGTHERQLHYEALYKVLEDIFIIVSRSNQNLVVGVPKFMGCALAGGNWHIVNAMLESLWMNSKCKLVVVDFNS